MMVRTPAGGGGVVFSPDHDSALTGGDLTQCENYPGNTQTQ